MTAPTSALPPEPPTAPIHAPKPRREPHSFSAAVRTAGSVILPAGAVFAFQSVAYPVPVGVLLQGLVLGLLNAMVVLGLVLVYRANRVVNLAQASIGTFPAALAGGVVLFGATSALATAGLAAAAGVTVLLGALTIMRLSFGQSLLAGLATATVSAVGLQVAEPFGWFGGFAVGVFVAVLAGIGVDAIVIRRLSKSPRLIVTVATIGLGQLFAVLGLLAPRLWGHVALVDPNGDHTGFEVPGDMTVTIGSTVFGSAELVAVAIALACIAVVGAALRWTDIGMAVRASADSSDRALMLGIPVPRIEAGVWIVASVLAFIATYIQAGILGLELTPGVGLRVMVAALGAMTLGGFRSLPSMLLAAISIGVLIQATGPAGGHSLTLTDALLAGIVVTGLLLRRASTRRADRDESSSWQTAAEPRGLPFELAGNRVFRSIRVLAVVAAVAGAAALPMSLSDSAILRVSTLVALVLVALSVVVLTGWTGEVTLGQMSFAASGAAVAAYVTLEWRVDLTLALLAAGLTGGLVAVLVALPSLRWKGIFLAVTTLAFALAATNYLLNPTVSTWIPTEDVARRPLFGVIDMHSRSRMYEVALATAVACFLAVAGIRRTRIGRVLRAVRDNSQGAQAYGIRVPIARLCAFALSGFVAGIGGGLLFAINERYEIALFGANESLNVFISSVVGGVGSMFGALLGSALIDGSRGFLSGPAGLLPSAVGVLGVLLLIPGGLAELLYRARDWFLRGYASKRNILVPSLVADRREPDATAHLTQANPNGDQPFRSGPGYGQPAAHSQGQNQAVVQPGGGWLEVRGLDVAYDKVQVLFGVDVDVRQGQITALLGTNGAGKSTLLKAIGGVTPATGGTIRLGDVDLGRLRPEEIPRHGIAQMPGGHGVFPSLTVDENLRVAAWLIRSQRAEVDQRIADARTRFPILESRRHSQAADLSGGQQQQLALAMALLAKPKLLLVDELSLGLAPVIVEELLEQMRALRDQGTTIVIVEQSVNVALTVADHAYFMEKGEIRFSDRAQALLHQPDLVRSVFLQGARDALASKPRPVPYAPLPPPRPQARARVPALELSSLAVAFGGIAAVNYVDIAAAPGEIVGLIGPNGAGKTTIFDLVSGLTPADSGSVRLHGQDISSLPPSARARRGIGRSFQDAKLFPGLTVAETISVALERWVEGDDLVTGAFRLPPGPRVERDIAQRVDELIELFGLQAFRSKPIGDLSTGSRRMVDLACVVAHSPSLVLLDEPSSGIAQREAEALGPVLLGLRDRLDATLIVIEHDISLISSVSDRLVALDQGEVVAAGEPAEVLDHPAVVASYLGTGGSALQRSDHTPARSGPGNERWNAHSQGQNQTPPIPPGPDPTTGVPQ